MATKRRVAKAYATKVGQVTYVTLRRKGVNRRRAGRIAKRKSRKTYRWAVRRPRRSRRVRRSRRRMMRRPRRRRMRMRRRRY